MSRAGAGDAARYALLSIVTAVATMLLKFGAWRISGSVGLLSDAFESLVNLGAAVVAFLTLRLAAQPPDHEHAFGHGKAEYFSSGFEGALIFLAALGIVCAAWPRLLHPQPLEQTGFGLMVAVVAALLNLAVARLLLRVGRERRSPALEADGRHLLSDVWTTAGIVVAVGVVALTGWLRLDALIAIAVALYLLWTGARLLREAAGGLMDRAWPAAERARLEQVLDGYRAEGIAFHAIRTRMSGSHRFVSLHVLVPGAWSVQHGHDLVERLEVELAGHLGPLAVFTHLEPIEDPAAQDEHRLERDAP
ncbi:cation diffusion facilitator family transporter [Solimonas soli]|uniref:cation diffusion facilitator family transporter n=1 Tax=Solimonas soli TaxID=413479 RepID=UPI000489FF80|nr:cation diffusion facilitator family transporter [Solimonas soli]